MEQKQNKTNYQLFYPNNAAPPSWMTKTPDMNRATKTIKLTMTNTPKPIAQFWAVLLQVILGNTQRNKAQSKSTLLVDPGITWIPLFLCVIETSI